MISTQVSIDSLVHIQDLKPVPLKIDQSNPDNHVARDPRMIRLTSVHPFNAEAPLDVLAAAGYITPSPLFFVRNHGAVPVNDSTDYENWTVSVKGLVGNPITLSMNDIMALPQSTTPVTLACAGNRRKEQNIVQKGNGFNWGSAGCSTALFTGPLLAHVLKLADPLSAAKYVCMEGSDLLPNGYYGTCVRLSWVNDTSRKILLAHSMNGSGLEKDHGRPIRVVIPGCIGGRSVKWLTRLILTDTPSSNFYHIYDNRVLPTMVSPASAKENDSWWRDERYALYHLNVQSVMTFPHHDTVLDLDPGLKVPVSLKGYAYSGGGRRIGRVEVSLDSGASWLLADIEYPEDTLRKHNGEFLFGGRIDIDQENCFTWCFWNLDVLPEALLNAKDVVVRAMDDGMNTQPRDMYWNVLSMLNNCWHRVGVHHEKGTSYRFEHPCLPALQKGGWMERVKAAGGNLLGKNWGESEISELSLNLNKTAIVSAPLIELTDVSVKRIITSEEVALHNTHDSAWFIINGQVYDASAYLKLHPGGEDSIRLVAGTDATEDFMTIHSETALKMLKQYHIGTLNRPLSSTAIKVQTEKTGRFLSELVWKPCVLQSREEAGPNVFIFRYALEFPDQEFGLVCGKHVFVRCLDLAGKFVMRAYTPISSCRVRGYFELLVKIYPPAPPRFPDGGRMTTLLHSHIPDSDVIYVKGPLGSFEYLGNGKCLRKNVEFQFTEFCMVAAGSVLQEIMDSNEDATVSNLIYANNTFSDILCYDQLQKWQGKKLQLNYCLSNPPQSWTGLTGFLNKDIIEDTFPSFTSNKKMMMLICGPPILCEIISKAAIELNWPEENIVIF